MAKRKVPIFVMVALFAAIASAGCGRHAIDPSTPDSAAAASPDPGSSTDPGTTPGTDPGTTPGTDPGTTPANPGGTTPASAAPNPPAPASNWSFQPLPKPRPTSALGPGPKPADPQQAIDQFVTLLQNFGYNTSSFDVKMQLMPLLRVPSENFHWNMDPQVQTTYQERIGTFPQPQPNFGQWEQLGLQLAQETNNVSFYVARAGLYRDILADRYACSGGCGLIFYKRYNNTNFMVCYGPDGTIDDYGYFPVINWTNFLPVPPAYWAN